MSTDKDDNWIALCQGDQQALRRVYETHAPAMLRYGYRFAERSRVEDAVHDLFVRLWERHAQLDPDTKPLPYLLVSLRNALFRSTKRAARTTDLEEANEDVAPTHEDEIVLAEESSDRSDSLKKALAQLAPRERELIALRYEQGLNYDEIVEITGLTYGAARNTSARAVSKLRRYLTLFFLSVMTNFAIMYPLCTGANRWML